MESLVNIGSIFFVLIIIALLSLAALTVFIERLWYLKKSERDTNHLLIQIRESLHLGNIAEAAGICEETGGPVATILRASIGKHAKSRQQIENTIKIAGMIEIASLEKNAKVLSVVAHLAPLIGLLGTVLGFIQAFSEMRLSGLVDISATGLGEAMELALITTAAGLAVAIPSVIAYNYIISRIASFVLEMESCSNEIMDILLEARGE